MPTVEEWQQALSREYNVQFDSSASLCDDVYEAHLQNNRERRRNSRPPLRIKPVVPFPPGSPGQRITLPVRIIDVLHAVGVVTTPPITELVDLSSTWAEIRYVWAFRPVFGAPMRPRNLRMNDVVKDLDFHQKTLLSDELGVGFGAYYMLQQVGATDPIDAFVAMKRGQFGLRGNRRRAIPDYIFRSGDGGGYYVIECKGTQSGRPTAINQLRRGTEQVGAVTISSPAPVTRLVIGASLKDAVTVYIIDPPDREHPEHDEPDARRIEPLVRWAPVEIATFAAAKRLTYIGDHQTADKILVDTVERLRPLPDAQRPLERYETDNGNFIGTTDSRRALDGRTLTIFRGLLQDLHQRDVSGVSRERATEKLLEPRPRRTFTTSATFHGGVASVQSISPEGTVLEIRIE